MCPDFFIVFSHSLIHTPLLQLLVLYIRNVSLWLITNILNKTMYAKLVAILLSIVWTCHDGFLSRLPFTVVAESRLFVSLHLSLYVFFNREVQKGIKKQRYSYFLKKKKKSFPPNSLTSWSPVLEELGSGQGKLLFSNISSNTNKQLLETVLLSRRYPPDGDFGTRRSERDPCSDFRKVSTDSTVTFII